MDQSCSLVKGQVCGFTDTAGQGHASILVGNSRQDGVSADLQALGSVSEVFAKVDPVRRAHQDSGLPNYRGARVRLPSGLKFEAWDEF